MRTPLRLAAALLIAGGLCALLGARPYNEVTLFTLLNGQPTRFIMADGGASGLFGSGQQCMTVSPGDVMKMTPSAAIFLCTPSPTLLGGWDGGCNLTPTDVNAGDYIGANVEHYVNNKDATSMCQVPVTGSVNMPVFRMQ